MDDSIRKQCDYECGIYANNMRKELVEHLGIDPTFYIIGRQLECMEWCIRQNSRNGKNES